MMGAIITLAFIACNHLIETGRYLTAQPAYLCMNETTQQFNVPCTND